MLFLLCLLSMYDNAANITSNNVNTSMTLIGITLLHLLEGSQLCILFLSSLLLHKTILTYSVFLSKPFYDKVLLFQSYFYKQKKNMGVSYLCCLFFPSSCFFWKYSRNTGCLAVPLGATCTI